MRLSALLREVGRNIATGTTRLAVLAAALATIVSVLVVADANAITQEVRASQEFRAAGAATLTLVAEGRIDGAACQGLNSIPGVLAAGALRQSSGKVVFTLLPDAPVPTFEVTPRFSALFGARDAVGAGIFVSREVADALRTSPGDIVNTAQGDTRVSSVFDYPADGRRQGFGYSALIPANAHETYDECWVEAWPALSNLGPVLFTALEPGSTDVKHPPTLSQLNSSLGERYDGYTLFVSRITRGALPLALLSAFALGYTSVRSRRIHMASALHVGLNRADVLLMALLETLSWAVPGAAIAAAVAVIAASGSPANDTHSVLLNVASIPLAAVPGACMGALLAGLLAKESHLFRYFKDR